MARHVQGDCFAVFLEGRDRESEPHDDEIDRFNLRRERSDPAALTAAMVTDPARAAAREEFRFARRGDDLQVDVPLTIPEALRGAEVKVPTLIGSKTLRVRPGTKHGTVPRLRGEGPSRLDGTASTYASFAYALPYYVVVLAVLWRFGLETFTFSPYFLILVLLRSLTDALAEGIAEHPVDWHMLQPLWLADLPARRPKPA